MYFFVNYNRFYLLQNIHETFFESTCRNQTASHLDFTFVIFYPCVGKNLTGCCVFILTCLKDCKMVTRYTALLCSNDGSSPVRSGPVDVTTVGARFKGQARYKYQYKRTQVSLLTPNYTSCQPYYTYLKRQCYVLCTAAC